MAAGVPRGPAQRSHGLSKAARALSESAEVRRRASEADWLGLRVTIVQMRSAWSLGSRDRLLRELCNLDTFVRRFRPSEVGEVLGGSVGGILLRVSTSDDSALRRYALSCLSNLTGLVHDFLSVFEPGAVADSLKRNLFCCEDQGF